MPSIILAIKYNIDFNFISHINEVKHRLSIKKIDNYVILDDAYNANLNGALYALEVMKSYKGKKFIITPGFVEMRSINLYLCEKFSEGINQCADICILEKVAHILKIKSRPFHLLPMVTAIFFHIFYGSLSVPNGREPFL